MTGAGITGRAVVAALTSWDVAVWVCDDSADALAMMAADGVATITVAEAIAKAGTFDLVVTSPGFPPTAPVLAAAAAAGVMSNAITSSAPTICTPCAATTPTSAANTMPIARTGTPRAAATSGSAVANSRGR